MTSLPLSCLIIEDEPLAGEILEGYVQQVPFLELKGIAADALSALTYLTKEPVDVLFLDIQLPQINGLDFLRSLPHAPQVILTTAYHQYALEGFELAVVDYLLKPIEFSRFLKAVNRLQQKESPTPRSAPSAHAPKSSFRFFNVNKSQVKVSLDEILFVESLKEYVRIQLPDRNLVTLYTLSDLEQDLSDPNLLRVHRSFLVAVNKIDTFSATEVEISGHRIPIGRSYKKEALKLLKGLV